MEKIINQPTIAESKNGLSSKEAEEALKKFGFNELRYFKIDILEIIKRNVLNFFNILLLLAFLISFITQKERPEPLLILFFFLAAVMVAILKDYHSNKLAQKLLSYFKNSARPRRINKSNHNTAYYICWIMNTRTNSANRHQKSQKQ